MKPILCVAAALVALPLLAADPHAAEPNLVDKTETKTVHTTIESIDRGARTVTLRDADGRPLTVVAGLDLKHFDELRVGDDVTVKYVEALAIGVHRKDEPAASGSRGQTFHGTGEKPAGARTKQKTETVTIDAVDPDAQFVTFTTDDGRRQSLHTDNPAILKGLHPGDQVDITWTTATIVSVD